MSAVSRSQGSLRVASSGFGNCPGSVRAGHRFPFLSVAGRSPTPTQGLGEREDALDGGGWPCSGGCSLSPHSLRGALPVRSGWRPGPSRAGRGPRLCGLPSSAPVGPSPRSSPPRCPPRGARRLVSLSVDCLETRLFQATETKSCVSTPRLKMKKTSTMRQACGDIKRNKG